MICAFALVISITIIVIIAVELVLYCTVPYCTVPYRTCSLNMSSKRHVFSLCYYLHTRLSHAVSNSSLLTAMKPKVTRA